MPIHGREEEEGKLAEAVAAMQEAVLLEKDEGRRVDIETLKRYYREGCARLAKRDAEIAHRFEMEMSGGMTKEAALDAIAWQEASTSLIIARRVSRAGRRLAAKAE